MHPSDIRLASKSTLITEVPSELCTLPVKPKTLGYEDPLFRNKLKSVRSKIGILLQEAVEPRLLLEPNSPGDQAKLQKRDLEFSSRFSRNYLYELKRHISKFDRMVNKKYDVVDKNVSQKVLSAHQLVLRGLQAYIKHAPTSLEEHIPERLKDLTKNFIKVTKNCVKIGILDNDELFNVCQNLLQASADGEVQVPALDCLKQVKRVDSQKLQPKATKSATTTRSGYYTQSSPYLRSRKRTNLKPSLQSINEHQVLKQRSAPTSKITTNRTLLAQQKSAVSLARNRRLASNIQVNLEPSRSQMKSPLAVLSEHSSDVKVEDKIKDDEKIKSIARSIVHETMKPFLKDLILILDKKKLLTTKEPKAVDKMSKTSIKDKQSKSVESKTEVSKVNVVKQEVTITGDKNAKLFCMQSTMDDSIDAENVKTGKSRDRLKTTPKRSSSKIRRKHSHKRRKHLELGDVKLVRVPQKMLKNTLAYRSKFQDSKLNNPMYNRIWEKHPLEVIQNATEDILTQTLEGITGELQLDELLKNMIQMEMCPS